MAPNSVEGDLPCVIHGHDNNGTVDVARVLVLFTGGTIGMTFSQQDKEHEGAAK